jgi:hypothetical protein
MTIRKNNENSPFWRAAAEASARVDRMPPWKLGVIEPRRPRPSVDDLLDELIGEAQVLMVEEMHSEFENSERRIEELREELKRRIK